MFKKSKDKTSIKGATVKALKKKVVQKKQSSIAKPKQKKQMTVGTPTQKKTQMVVSKPQVKESEVATPQQKSTQVMTFAERMAKAKSVLAYSAGLTKSARADRAKKEASLNARLREATKG